MLVNVDAAALEWRTCAFLSQDEVALQEIWNRLDAHSDNQQKFGLPSRLIAKKFLFRLIFGGTAAAYSYDPEFDEVGFSKKQWQESIDAFYHKYKGIAKWHQNLIQTAIGTGQLVSPTNRIYRFKQFITDYGERKWPETTIKNYLVQGLGADLMMIYRLHVAEKMRKQNLKSLLVSSVHDSIVADCPEDEYKHVAQLKYDCAREVPRLFEQMFGKKYNVPFEVEVQYGPNMKEMEDISEHQLDQNLFEFC